MIHLTGERSNVEAHRLAGDTLVVACPSCEHGEIVVTDMLEDGLGRCIECGSAFQLFMNPSAS